MTKDLTIFQTLLPVIILVSVILLAAIGRLAVKKFNKRKEQSHERLNNSVRRH